MPSEPFIGQVVPHGFNFAPRGYAFCEGQLLPIAQNTALFSLLGTTYGGDGRTTFGLPDLRGRFPIHRGNGPGLTPRQLGQSGGSQTHTLTEAEIPNHSHAVETFVSDSNASTTYPGGASLAQALTDIYGDDSDLVPLAASSSATAGSSQAHNNLPPYLGVSYCIALVGLYPSRS
jgi:microcystin-dependent protein